MDILSLLPRECALHCLSFLEAHDISSISRVSKPWYQLALDNQLWKTFCFRLECNAPVNGFPSYKQAYLYRRRLLWRWRSGQCQTVTKLCEGATDFSCLHYNQQYIAAGSFDQSIKIWSLQTLEQCLLLKGHSDIVTHVKFHNHHIFSCSRDGTMKLWDMSGNCLYTVALHHGKAVRCFQIVNDQYVISGGEDNRVVRWKIGDNNSVQDLYSHENVVTVLAYDHLSNTLLSGSRDASLKVYAFDGEQVIKSIVGHTDSITCLSFTKNRIVSGSRDKTLRVWNRTDFRCILTIPHSHWITSVACDEDKVLSNCIDSGDLALYSMKNGELFHIFKSHTKLIRAIQFDYAKIVTCSNDGSIAILSFDDCGRRMSTIPVS